MHCQGVFHNTLFKGFARVCKDVLTGKCTPKQAQDWIEEKTANISISPFITTTLA